MNDEMTNKNNNSVDEEILKRNVSNFVQIIKKPEIKKILYSSIIPIVALFFYSLAYLFFAGFYFGGTKDNTVPMLELIINPIPFNYKGLILLGSVLLCFFISLTYIGVNLTKSLVLNQRSMTLFCINMSLFFFLIILIHSILYFFLGSHVMTMERIYGIWAPLLGALLILILLFNKEFTSIITGVIIGFISFIVVALVFKPREVNSTFYIVTVIAGILLLFDPIKNIKKKSLSFGVLFLLSFYVVMNVSLFKSIIIYLSVHINIEFLVLFFSLIVSLFIYITLILVRKMINIKKIMKKLKFFSANKYSKNEKLIERYTFLKSYIKTKYIYVGSALVIICEICFMSWWIFRTGVLLHDGLNLNVQNKIVYFDGQKLQAINGKIVLINDGVAYISSEENRLIMIRSNQIVVE